MYVRDGIEPKRIQDTRKALKLSKVGFANLLGVGINTIYRWEKGEVAPYGPQIRVLEALEKLAADKKRQETDQSLWKDILAGAAILGAGYTLYRLFKAAYEGSEEDER